MRGGDGVLWMRAKKRPPRRSFQCSAGIGIAAVWRLHRAGYSCELLLTAGGLFSSLCELLGRVAQVAFQCFHCLLSVLGQLLVAGVGVAQSRLQQCDSVFRTGWCVLGDFINQSADFTAGVSDLRFSSLGQFSLGSRHDAGQVTTVSGGLFCSWLCLSLSQRQQFLRILDGSELLRSG